MCAPPSSYLSPVAPAWSEQRAQEWNISRKELQELLDLGLLQDEAELRSVISVEFNPVRDQSSE